MEARQRLNCFSQLLSFPKKNGFSKELSNLLVFFPLLFLLNGEEEKKEKRVMSAATKAAFLQAASALDLEAAQMLLNSVEPSEQLDLLHGIGFVTQFVAGHDVEVGIKFVPSEGEIPFPELPKKEINTAAEEKNKDESDEDTSSFHSSDYSDESSFHSSDFTDGEEEEKERARELKLETRRAMLDELRASKKKSHPKLEEKTEEKEDQEAPPAEPTTDVSEKPRKVVRGHYVRSCDKLFRRPGNALQFALLSAHSNDKSKFAFIKFLVENGADVDAVAPFCPIHNTRSSAIDVAYANFGGDSIFTQVLEDPLTTFPRTPSPEPSESPEPEREQEKEKEETPLSEHSSDFDSEESDLSTHTSDKDFDKEE